MSMRRSGTVQRNVWRDNGLSIALFAFFLLSLAGQGYAGWREHNAELAAHAQVTLDFVSYLLSGAFLEVTMENWESEFLQMFVYVVFTVFLFQRGSSESKDPDVPREPEPPVTSASPRLARRGGWQATLYANSMSAVFLLMFFGTFLLHAKGGAALYNQEQLLHGEPPVSFWSYLGGTRFWFESLQNWQSEFLSLWAMVVFSIFLRQRGSPESKPVASSHFETGR